MTSLTEKWKKGELPTGWYWVDYYSVGAVMLEYIPQHNGFGYEEKKLVQAVLAEVPSYEKWIMTENLSERAHLEMYKARGEKVRLEKENTKLRELLKECELWFTGIVGNINDENVGEHNRNIPIGNFKHAFKLFSRKINQTLGEE